MRDQAQDHKQDHNSELTDAELDMVVGGAGGADKNQDPPPK